MALDLDVEPCSPTCETMEKYNGDAGCKPALEWCRARARTQDPAGPARGDPVGERRHNARALVVGGRGGRGRCRRDPLRRGPDAAEPLPGLADAFLRGAVPHTPACDTPRIDMVGLCHAEAPRRGK